MSCDDLFWAKYNLSGALGREEGLKARIAELEKERDDLLLRNRETRGHLQGARDKLAELTAERDALRRQVAELEKDRDSAVDAIDIMMRRHDDELHAAHANGRAERDAESSRSQCNPCGSDFIIGANASPRRT